MLQQPESPAAKVAALTARFYLGVQRTAAVLGAVVRALSAPRGIARTDAEHFTEIVRSVVREELAR